MAHAEGHAASASRNCTHLQRQRHAARRRGRSKARRRELSSRLRVPHGRCRHGAGGGYLHARVLSHPNTLTRPQTALADPEVRRDGHVVTAAEAFVRPVTHGEGSAGRPARGRATYEYCALATRHPFGYQSTCVRARVREAFNSFVHSCQGDCACM
jgi:hypothetical protein